MIITEQISPLIALIAGFLILILPSLLNYVIALYLIITGLVGLNGIYHFVGCPRRPARQDLPGCRPSLAVDRLGTDSP
jgi:hypothetical protein